MSKELSHEASLEQAAIIRMVMTNVKMLDVEYLTLALSDMRKNHSMRKSAMVLNPSPLTAIEQSELEEAKLKQLELMLALAVNLLNIAEKQVKLQAAKSSSNDLARFFGQ